MSGSVQLSPQAVKDLAKIAKDRRVVERVLEALGHEPRAANLDIKALRGREPWARARAGSYRIIFRPVSGRGYLVYAIVHRRDLERAIGKL